MSRGCTKEERLGKIKEKPAHSAREDEVAVRYSPVSLQVMVMPGYGTLLPFFYR